jgi:hypothetical protein
LFLSASTKNAFAAVTPAGYFVLVEQAGHIYWGQPNSAIDPGAVTMLQDDGVLIIKSKVGEALWKSPAFMPCT